MKRVTSILLLTTILLFGCSDSDVAHADDNPGTKTEDYIYNPSQANELKAILNGKLVAGDIVYLADGTYKDLQLTFTGKGTASKPIVLKAKNPGKVILTGALNIKIGGEYLVVDGLVLKDGQAASGSDIIEFRSSSSNFASNCRLTNTVIDNCNHPDESYRTSTSKSERWVMLYGKNNRVDHCYFTNKVNGGVLLMVNISAEGSRVNNHIIDYNFFSNRPLFSPGNNAEIIRLGDSSTSQESCNTVVENNFFNACDGEVEIISIKSCNNIIRKNVFYESQGSVVCRHGNDNVIESNAFIGNNIKNTGGVRIINQGHKVYNNYFQDLQGTSSYSALCIMTAVFEKPTSATDKGREPLNAYHRVKDVDICYNTFVNCKNIDLGKVSSYTYPSDNPYFPGTKVTGTLKPECTVAYNVFYNPSSNSILNRIGSNDEFITYAGNLVKFKQALTLDGFEVKELDFQKNTSGAGKGFYALKNTSNSILSATQNTISFSYVVNDITGSTRSGTKDSGAYQYANKGLSFTIAPPSKCGVSWYSALTSERTIIDSKTVF
ncbi:polysaccharide lyase 6 family protein [Dysgonomonas sp. 511]|uniref:polysaccharide lyase 6 family protein n=1 Tax=Dysgonomonas sp. 511 TaxID=2302930 RepID=UPI0013D7E891|nr:polysaccharide lyase 6 family protein [Dysgonomonas sp. 511]